MVAGGLSRLLAPLCYERLYAMSVSMRLVLCLCALRIARIAAMRDYAAAPTVTLNVTCRLSPELRLIALNTVCLLYTSDAADDLLCVDLGGRRIIKKKI